MDAAQTTTEVLDLEERNLLPRHLAGDRTAFPQLLRRYQALVYTFLYRYGVNPAARDDLFQDIFLKIHLAAASYRPRQALRPWLVTIVLNTVRNYHRDQSRLQQGQTRLRSLAEPQAPAVEDQVIARDRMSWLETRIGLLPQVQREVLVLATLRGFPAREISKLLRIPENTVKTHLRRARLALAQQLAEREAVEEPDDAL